MKLLKKVTAGLLLAFGIPFSILAAMALSIYSSLILRKSLKRALDTRCTMR
jgi:hypothetical protein